MGKRIGIFCILLGIACLLASAGFAIYNRHEAQSGEASAQRLLQAVQDQMAETAASQPDPTTGTLPQKTEPREMATVPVGDYASIGILAIPALEVELPVLTDWSYEKLKKAPCHYYGSCYESDFVIAAHNYVYEVVLLETLPPTATEEMITSGFDLSLYTCTPGGSNRVTLRCRRLSD